MGSGTKQAPSRCMDLICQPPIIASLNSVVDRVCGTAAPSTPKPQPEDRSGAERTPGVVGMLSAVMVAFAAGFVALMAM
jgi:hypothetical protein